MIGVFVACRCRLGVQNPDTTMPQPQLKVTIARVVCAHMTIHLTVPSLSYNLVGLGSVRVNTIAISS